MNKNENVVDYTDDIQGENGFSSSYSEKSLMEKIMSFAKLAGISVVYVVLLLYYTLKKVNLPVWAKSTIVGSLGYFIFPVDIIPDVLPGVGLTDDLGILMASLAAVACYIDDDVKKKAKTKLKDWFGEYDESSLDEVENKIG
jgi:uncharacterized membrane protein YkvA (DUF1232 family)